MTPVYIFFLTLLFIFLLIPVWESIHFFLIGCFVALTSIDIIKLPCDKNTIWILIKNLSDKNYNRSRKLFLRHYVKNTLDLISGSKNIGYSHREVFWYKDYQKGTAMPFNIALRNIILFDISLLPKAEDIVIDRGLTNRGLIFDFALCTKDIDFSRKKLLVGISKTDKRSISDFMNLFDKDEELKKIASLL